METITFRMASTASAQAPRASGGLKFQRAAHRCSQPSTWTYLGTARRSMGFSISSLNLFVTWIDHVSLFRRFNSSYPFLQYTSFATCTQRWNPQDASQAHICSIIMSRLGLAGGVLVREKLNQMAVAWLGYINIGEVYCKERHHTFVNQRLHRLSEN